MPRLVLGSRGSALALAQVRLVEEALRKFLPDLEVEVKIIATSGDRHKGTGEGTPSGLKGLFTKEIQEALLDGSIDAAVHSLKDLPGATPPALEIAAVLERADPSDLLISKSCAALDALPDRARIGTSSVRRRRQLEWLRPGIEVVELRGNVPTRLARCDSFDAIVLARAGLERLGYSISAGRLESESGAFLAAPLDILPAIGQGVIGIETRRDDSAARALLAPIDHPPTHACIRVERELLRLLDGDCRLPVGARVTLDQSAIYAEAIVFRDGSPQPAQARAAGPADDPESLALHLFKQLSAP
jgi:hydroxymethylbilane synthase